MFRAEVEKNDLTPATPVFLQQLSHWELLYTNLIL